jgi:CheY-like chemotaxis protein
MTSIVAHLLTRGSLPVHPVVLVVDDNPQNLELFATWIARLPASVVTAEDGIRALESVSRQRPDLIVLDVMMPRMSGFEVCRHLKSSASTRAVPVLVVTALNESDDVEAARHAGADAVVSKPVGRWELLGKIRTLLGDVGGDGG